MLEVVEGPAVILTAEDVWRLLTGRLDRQALAALRTIARRWEAEEGWRSSLVPACQVAEALGITEHALRRRLARGTWAGEKLGRRWFAVPPSSPLAPRSAA